MDERIARRIQTASLASKEDIELGLAQALMALAGNPLKVQDARNGFSELLRKAKRGAVQLVGRDPEKMAVIMSLRDLAEIVHVASRPQSLADALNAMGFQPVDKRIVIGEGRARERPTRHRTSPPGNDLAI